MTDLHQPVDTSAQPSIQRAVAVVTSIALILLISSRLFPSFAEDSASYEQLMQNHWSVVHQPFSSRFLHAELVWVLTRFAHLQLRSAVTLVAVVSLSLVVLGMDRIFARLRTPPMLLVPVLVCFVFMETYLLAYMPDLFYTLLLVGLFLLLMDQRFFLSVLMVFVLFSARESTLVLGLVLTILSINWRMSESRDKWLPWGFLIATAAGFLFNRFITSKSAGNMHEMSGMMYLVGKVPFNFLKNVLGVEPWTDTLLATEGGHPLYSVALPHGLHLGSIHHVGIAEVSARYPLRWLANSISAFGVLPAVVGRQWLVVSGEGKGRWRHLHAAIRFVLDQPFYSQVALVYGIISLAIAPLLGTAVHRYIYYAWPAFWITGISLISPRLFQSRSATARLLILHVLLVWIPLLVSMNDANWGRLFVLLMLAVCLQLAVWKTLSNVIRQV